MPPGGEGRLLGVFPVRTIRGSLVSETSGACGKTYQFGFVFRLLFVGGPVPRASLVAPAPAVFLAATAAAAAASGSRRRRSKLLHLPLALSPAAQKTSLLKGKHLSERSECPASTDREGCPPSAAPRPPGLPKPRQTRRKPRWCHHSALGQALPLSSCNHRGRLRPRGGV